MKQFLHPGLTTKKVLITKKGICKLYDFFLAEDASQIAKNIKLKVSSQVTSYDNQTPGSC